MLIKQHQLNTISLSSVTELENEAPFTRICFFFFLESGYDFRPHVSGESGIRIRSPEGKFLNTLWILNRVDAKSGYFLSGDITRSSPVLYRTGRVRCKPRALYNAFPVEWIRIRDGYIWTGKFDFNTDTCRAEIFESGKKNLRIEKYPDTCGRGLK